MQENAKKPAIRFAGFDDAWEQRKLGDYCNITTGKLDANAMVKDGQYDFYTSGIQKYKIDVAAFEGPAITIAGNGATVGYMHLADGKFNAYQRTYVLGSFHAKRQYLYYAIGKTLPDKIAAEARTGNIPYIVMDMLTDLNITIPNSEEQEKIGRFLASIDNLIALHQRKYTKLVNIKQSMLEKMFPQDGSNVPEIRFAGFTDAWEQRKLSKIASMHARIGWQNLRKSEFLDSGDYYLITGTDFVDGTINLSTCHYVEHERYEQDKNIQVSNGSILITKDGTLGKVAYVSGLNKPATLNAGVFNVKITASDIDGKYLFQYLKGPFLMDYVDKRATGGTIKHLNQNILVDFPILAPCYDEQKLIGTLFSELDHLIALHQRKLEKLQNIKKSCLEKMFV